MCICTLVCSVQISFANEMERSLAKVKSVDQNVVKIVSLLAKRTDKSRPQFRQYYENNHVPLARGVFEGWPGYVRNHIEKVYPQQTLNFDVLTMFWYRDSLHFKSTVELLNGDAGKIIRADEDKFMSKATNRYYQVVESGSGLVYQRQRPWVTGFQQSTIDASKVIALVPSVAAKRWLALLNSYSDTNESETLLSWVNNHVADKPEDEFEEISELWFSNLSDAENSILKWRTGLPEIIFLSVSAFESSTL